MTAGGRLFESALLLDGSGGARELSDEEVRNWSPDDGLLWVDCDQNNAAVKEWLTRQPDISHNARNILLAGETRPRAIVEEDGLLVILRGINMNPGAVPDDMVAVRMWLQRHRIITAHRRKLLSIQDVNDALRVGSGPKSVGEFLVTLAVCLGRRINAAVENIEDLVDEQESEVAKGDIGDLRVALGVVRRQAAAIRRHLAPQRDTLDRIVRAHAGLLSEREIFDLREEGDQLTRYVEDLDLARENALVTQEELMNRVAQEQNARVYLLSVVAAIFLPLTFVTGMLGMNVAGLPGTENPRGFLISAEIMLVLGIGLVAYFKWRKWI
jgi:zinc transporter